MFYKKIPFSELKNTDKFSKMKDDQVYQVVQKGSFKVLMTQEKYFSLLSKIERLESSLGKESKSVVGNDGLSLDELKKDLKND